DVGVGALDELAAQQHIAGRRMNEWRAGRDIRVGLVLRPKKHVTLEVAWRLLCGDLLQISGRSRPDIGRRIWRQRLAEIIARKIERSHSEIQRTALQIDARQV